MRRRPCRVADRMPAPRNSIWTTRLPSETRNEFMPELPEVETTLRGIAPHAVGHVIQAICVLNPRLRWPVPRAIQRVVGSRISGARRRAKYLMLDTAAGSLLIHLGMSGSLRVVNPASEWRKHDHLAIRLDTGKEIRFHDPRRFGTVLLTQKGEQHRLLRNLGPEPLGDAFTADYLFAMSRKRSVSAKHFIMDARVVVGVGNIYACEALFWAGIRPSRPAGRLSRRECSRLVRTIRKVLRASIRMGGTTLRDFLHGSGEPGYFKQSLRVYDREAERCKRCGSTIRRTRHGQRSTFWCPGCQK